MKKLSRHVAVFCVGLMVAVALAFWIPLDVDPKQIMFGFVAVFFLYLGLSFYFDPRKGNYK